MKAKKNYRLNRAAIAAIAALAIAAAWAIVSAVGKAGDAESLRREFFEKKDLDAGMSCAKAMLANGDAQGAQILRMLADIGREDAAKRLAKTLKKWEEGAAAGDVRCAENLAQYNLKIWSGNPAQNRKTALFWARKAEALGSEKIHKTLYEIYRDGPEENRELAFKHLKRSADSGDTDSLMRLGEAYARGYCGAPRDAKKAAEAFAGAFAGSPEPGGAHAEAAALFLSGALGPERARDGADFLNAACERILAGNFPEGGRPAEFAAMAARLFEEGPEDVKNPEMARLLMEKLEAWRAGGDTSASMALYRAYNWNASDYPGLLPPDSGLRKEFYLRRAAGDGNPIAMMEMAKADIFGEKSPQFLFFPGKKTGQERVEAQKYAERLEEILPSAGPHSNIVAAELGLVYMHLGNFRRAAETFERSSTPFAVDLGMPYAVLYAIYSSEAPEVRDASKAARWREKGVRECPSTFWEWTAMLTGAHSEYPVKNTALYRESLRELIKLGDTSRAVELAESYDNPEDRERILNSHEILPGSSDFENLSVGMKYFEGETLGRNPARAAEFLQKAAEGGNVEAMAMMFFMYSEGCGVEKNPAAAQKLLGRMYAKTEADGGRRAAETLGRAGFRIMNRKNYGTGSDIPKSFKGGFEIVEKAVLLGDLSSAAELAKALAADSGFPERYDRAVRILDFALERLPENKENRSDIMEICEAMADICENPESGRHFNPEKAFEFRKREWGVRMSLFACSRYDALKFAQYYAGGRGVAKDHAKAAEILAPYAGEDPIIKEYLAWLYEHGEGLEKNPGTAGRLRAEIRKGEAPFRCYRLYAPDSEAGEYYRGLLDEDEARAKYWLLQSVKTDPRAERIYRRLYGTPESDREKKSSAMTALGLSYCYGVGTVKDMKRGISLLEEAAGLGNPEAMASLFQLLPKTTAGESARAEGYLQAAARAGNPDALMALACRLLKASPPFDAPGFHEGVPPGDVEKAYGYMERAAESGSEQAWMALADAGRAARLSKEGAANPRCAPEAMFKRAAKWSESRQSPRSHMNLGLFCMLGIGTEKDFPRARVLFDKSARMGYAPALACLARMAELGLGEKADLEKSERLLKEMEGLIKYREVFDVAAMYLDGGLLGPDREKAGRFMRLCNSMAAERGAEPPFSEEDLGRLSRRE